MMFLLPPIRRNRRFRLAFEGQKDSLSLRTPLARRTRLRRFADGRSSLFSHGASRLLSAFGKGACFAQGLALCCVLTQLRCFEVAGFHLYMEGLKPIEQLVPVSCMRCRTSTPGLSTWWSSTVLKGELVSRWVSRLDAFSGYPVRT